METITGRVGVVLQFKAGLGNSLALEWHYLLISNAQIETSEPSNHHERV